MKQQFLAETPDTFRTYIYESNLKAVPESANITIQRPGGAALVEGVVMTIGGDGLLSFELSADDNLTPGLDYKAEVEYSIDSKTHYAVLFYDVVRSRLAKVITDDDIFSELPQLRDRGWSVSGTAEGGLTLPSSTADLRGTETLTLPEGWPSARQKPRQGR
jgi:hypothetical protein